MNSKRDKLKVMHVITDTNIGGAGVVLLIFLDNYNKKEFEMSVLIPEQSLLKDELIKRRCPYKEVPEIADKSFSIKAVNHFLRIFRRIKPDIVHTHASVSAKIAARIYGKCGVIYTRHCAYELASYKKSFPYKTATGFINNYLADKIIAISPAARDNLIDTGVSPKKIEVMFNGVQPVKVLSEEEKSKVRARYGIGEDDFVCAIIARLVKVKGHEYVLEAFQRLEKSDSSIKLIIVGAGPEEQSLKRKAADLNLKNCIFTGFVKDVYEIENIMHIQLNASYGTETSSLSLLEGMSLGIPAVASDFGGNPFLIKNNVNGIIVPKKNSKKFFDAIMELKNNPERYSNMAKNSLKIYNESFTSEKMSRRIEKIYKEMNAK